MHYYITAYTIHFDDTMAYGSHHFLTSFKFQCFSRESFLFGEQIFDLPGVRNALDSIHLLTADAYARNLNPARLGDRVAILLTIEDWQRASARFCYRVINAHGTPICAGFQSLICADAHTSRPVPLPTPLWDAMEKMRGIEEPLASESFREKVLAGGSQVESLFGDVERNTAIHYLAERYPSPKLIPATQPATVTASGSTDGLGGTDSFEPVPLEAWVFAGQGAFTPKLLSERVAAYERSKPSARRELEQCAAIAQELIGGDAYAVVSGRGAACAAAVEATPGLSQFAIHLQNVLGAYLRHSQGFTPGILMGHSFGEIAAFGVAGCFDLPTGVRIIGKRVRAIAEHASPDGALLAVLADRATVVTETALNCFEQVEVAGRNHEGQTVVSGPRDQLERLRDCLRRIGIQSISIPSQTSYHHSRLRSSALAWLEHLRRLPLQGPSRALYTCIGRRFIMPREDIAAVLASQLLRPFDFQGGISDVTEAGATKFVDCGSPGSLAKIIAKAGAEGLDVSGIVLIDGNASNITRSPDRSDSTHLRSPRDNGQKPNRQSNTVLMKQRVGERHVRPPVAIVGQGCILPGGASSPEQLFAAIMEQRTGIIDQRRLDPHWEEDFYSANLVPDRSTSPLGGCIEDREIVAPAGIDQNIFKHFSRAQRLLTMALAPCVESLKGAQRILCFIGATADGFEDQDAVTSLRLAGIDPTDHKVNERMNIPRSAFQEPHDAVREVFDRIVRPGLEIILVDAACASSLHSVALGLHALEANRADAVIAGGVFCPGPGNSCLFSQFRATSSTRCRPFAANADGVVFSEGAAVVTLRRVADAERLKLPIAAVVRGVGLSSDGRSSSANVPQTHGQILSLERCYQNYGMDPTSIDAIEGHGTSTPVGDNTEIETLRQFFSGRVQQPILLHSLKGLLGHAGWAAGTASIIAVCEYLRNGVFPAQANHREPSEALIRSAGTLTVPKQPHPLPPRWHRIAIDGFGFGGANAHVVLDNHVGPTQGQSQDREPEATTEDDELVFVAFHEVVPTLSTEDGLQFDRERVSLPKGHVLLPDLVDDMDISQKLALALVDGIVAKLTHFDAALQRETSVLLAQSGKTERGVGATLRVLANRFRRMFAGLDHVLETLAIAGNSVRPSGPYTLQCMMPNVAAGRAALQLNLNGPNFVVDAGSNSLEAAMTAASLLLLGGDSSGTKLVIVTVINANPWRVSRGDSLFPEEEFAAAFAVTSRRYAKELKLHILSPVEKPLKKSCQRSENEGASTTTAQKVRRLLDRLQSIGTADPKVPTQSDAASSTETEFPIYTPVWVEVPAEDRQSDSMNGHETAIVAIVPAHQDRVAKLARTLPNYARRYRIVVVGDTACEVISQIDNPHVTAADLTDEKSIGTVLAEIDRFGADVILALESITTWDRGESLTKLATDNSLCELVFLIARSNVARLARGELELWGLFPDAWNGTVHPATGPIAGLLKAIAREIATVRVGLVCTRNRSLSEAVECVLAEQSLDNPEREVAYDGTTRLARRLREACHVTGVTQMELDSHSVVVATGGARGVTAILMDALLRDFQCTVVALGRSSPEVGPANMDDPQGERDFYARFMRQYPHASAVEMKRQYEKTRACWETHRTIQQLSALGGRVEYMVADVTDRDQVADVVQQIVSKYGRIDLLVHGAGIQISTRLENRSLAEFRRTFSVKVKGLRHLTDQCRMQLGKTVATHVLTSAYSIFGNDGQHDYGAANETLDRLCGMSAVNEGSRWSSIAWLAWDGIGMTRNSEYHALSKLRGLSGLTAEHGQEIFRRVLAGRTDADINVPLSVTEHAKYEVMTIPTLNGDADGRILERRIELSKIDFLSHHKVRGAPTLPGAWILDHMVMAGLELWNGASPITSLAVRDAMFHRFIRSTENECNLRVVAQRAGDRIAVWMIGDVRHPAGPMLSKDVVFAQAILSFEHAAREIQSPLQNIDCQGSNGNGQRLQDPYCNGRHKEIELSGPFDCLRDIVIGPNGRRARFDPGRSLIASNSIPALVLDAALRVGAMYAVHGKNDLYVPVRIGRVVVPVGPHAKSLSASSREIRTTAPIVENGHVHWDRTEALDENGAAILVVEDAYATRLQ